MVGKEIGNVISADYNEGVVALLNKYSLTENVSVNSLVIIRGSSRNYLGLMSDIFLSSNTSDVTSLLRYYNTSKNRNIRDKLMIKTKESLSNLEKLNTNIHIIPLAQTNGEEIEDVDTIPSFFSQVVTPVSEEIKTFYGIPDNQRYWGLGYPKSPLKNENIETIIPIDINTLLRGSFGIFGKTGTGKTVLGNIICGFLILANKLKSLDKEVKLLIFDMHSEYGLKIKDMKGEDYAEGVGLAFKNEFLRYSADKALAKEHILEELKISVIDLDEADIISLKEELDLSESFISYLHEFRIILNEIIEKEYVEKYSSFPELKDKKSKAWILYLTGYFDKYEKQREILENKISKTINERLGPGAIGALRAGKAKISSIMNYDYIEYFTEKDSVNEIVNEILDGQRSVIISLGRYGDDSRANILIANLVSKRLWKTIINRIMNRKEIKYKVLIFIEEAHKFLSPSLYYKTPFGNIARELRKRGVFLCIIDQTPSQISEEILAMLWNFFILTLTDEKDIKSATFALKKSELFSPVVSYLKRQEALVYGEAVKIPVVIKIREYKDFIEEAKRIYSNLLSKAELPGF
jgi:DNA helicase HerA-like ATPase